MRRLSAAAGASGTSRWRTYQELQFAHSGTRTAARMTSSDEPEDEPVSHWRRRFWPEVSRIVVAGAVGLVVAVGRGAVVRRYDVDLRGGAVAIGAAVFVLTVFVVVLLALRIPRLNRASQSERRALTTAMSWIAVLALGWLAVAATANLAAPASPRIDVDSACEDAIGDASVALGPVDGAQAAEIAKVLDAAESSCLAAAQRDAAETAKTKAETDLVEAQTRTEEAELHKVEAETQGLDRNWKVDLAGIVVTLIVGVVSAYVAYRVGAARSGKNDATEEPTGDNPEGLP